MGREGSRHLLESRWRETGQGPILTDDDLNSSFVDRRNTVDDKKTKVADYQLLLVSRRQKSEVASCCFLTVLAKLITAKTWNTAGGDVARDQE